MPKVRLPYLVASILAGLAVALVVVVLAVNGSGGSGTNTAAGPPTTVHVPQPAGPNPSASARMVCASEAQRDLDGVLGVNGTVPDPPTWSDHLYSCRYVYSNGSMALSVKELPDRGATTNYYDSLRNELGVREQLKGMAQGAFLTNNDSLVARKDYKVLIVDPTGLPIPFGSLFTKRSDVALTVGLTVLGCWTGA
jgi:hypothetical protein